MKKIVLTSLMAMFAVSAASAAITPYTSLKLGYVDIDSIKAEYNGTVMGETEGMNGYSGSIAFGAKFDVSEMISMRGELEYTYSDTEQDKVDLIGLKNHAFMLNGYADFGKASWAIKPYVGLGVGYAIGQLGPSPTEEDVFGIIYGVSAGIAYDINSNFALDLGVKYTIQDLEWHADSDLVYKCPALAFTLGARYMF